VPKSTLKIGILGAGAMGATHVAAYRAIADAKVVGVWSRRLERAERLAREIGGKVVAAPRALLDDPAVDAIDLCVPTEAHRDLVIAALAAGKHVICETPLALAIDDAEAMIAAACTAKRLLFVGLLMRSAADYVYLRDQVHSGGYGKLRSIALWRLGSYLRPGAPDGKPHYGDPSTELMTFDFDVLNWLLGPAESLAAVATTIEAERSGEITALLHYSDGASAVVTGSGIVPKEFPFTVGFRALLEGAVLEHQTVFHGDSPESRLVLHAAGEVAAPLRIRRQNPYECELRHCLDCIRNGTASELLGAEHAVAALRLSLATQRALREGSTQRLR
jgi:predicted dehydrogenase